MTDKFEHQVPECEPLKIEDFESFYRAIHGYKPFQWQSRLAEQVCRGKWPEYLKLPTASGKTAAIDIAVFALAFQAAGQNRPDGQITAARRIFFVVDRRIVVNEAYEQTKAMAKLLQTAFYLSPELNPDIDVADRDVLIRVAQWLQHLSGDPQIPSVNEVKKPPLDCFELRGGIYRDDAWVRSPLQPTVLASTVDQVGSRLMFRGYGVTDNNLSIHAGLTANDSLIILDEAHCSKPFSQTMESINRYRSAQWAEQPIETPFSFVQMTATPPANLPDDKFFTLDKTDYQNDGLLGKRHACTKPVALELAKGAKGKKLTPTLAKKMASRANNLHEKSAARKIAVVVNRVDLAREVFSLLAKDHGDRVELMIGRMRPLDRDKLTKALQKNFASGWAQEGLPSDETEPRFVVATQCLEVGADLDFDGMISQCASLDALRQRFGRLNRLGDSPQACGVVVAAEGDIQPIEKLDDDKPVDPIYGNALCRTWHWMSEAAEEIETDEVSERVIDFGIKALDSRTSALGKELEQLLAPTLNAPVLMPAHVDMLCQTSPRPTPEPDVAAYLHGVEPDPNRDRAEVRICWRADLDLNDHQNGDKETADRWLKTIEVCPPSTAECLNVPLNLFRRWLKGAGVTDQSSDVLGEATQQDDSDAETHKKERAVFIWRGKKRKTDTSERSFRVTRKNRSRLKPNDTIVIPAEIGGWDTFGHVPDAPPDPAEKSMDEVADVLNDNEPECSRIAGIDVADEAFLQSRAKTIVRIHPKLIPHPTIEQWYRDLLRDAMDQNSNLRIQDYHDLMQATIEIMKKDNSRDRNTDSEGQLNSLSQRLLESKNAKLVRYPSGLAWITERHDEILPGLPPLPSFGDDADSLSFTERVSLSQHLADVVFELDRLTTVLSLPEPFRTTILESGRAHDLGKADPRFQAMLIDKPLSVAYMQSQLWAKSDGTGRNKSNDLPEGFRHEMLSLDLLERIEIDGSSEIDLLRHLVASHHGRARPFASVCVDDAPPGINLHPFQLDDVSDEERKSWTPAHRLDSGIADRFWNMTRRYGWWGLSYLETLLRLSDWKASASPHIGNPENLTLVASKKPTQTNPSINDTKSVVLSGLDGSNPLAFLAALGTFRTLSSAAPEQSLKMAWKQHEGAWRPVICSMKEGFSEETVLDLLKSLSMDPLLHPSLRTAQEVDEHGMRKAFSQAVAKAEITARADTDWLSCNGSDVIEPTVISQLQTTRRDYHSINIKGLVSETTREHLQRSLFEIWDYSDPIAGVSLHLEPREDRRHAYQWHKPSGDPTRNSYGGMIGANRLALEAWPLFQSLPMIDKLTTVGFTGTKANDTQFSWPIWSSPVTLEVVPSILSLRGLKSKKMNNNALKPIGIETIFCCERILVGKTPNLTSPTAVLC